MGGAFRTDLDCPATVLAIMLQIQGVAQSRAASTAEDAKQAKGHIAQPPAHTADDCDHLGLPEAYA